jgi:hypothetical protein
MMRISQRNRRRMVPVIDQMESRELLSTMVGLTPHAAVPPQSSAVTGLNLATSPTVTRSILTATTAIAANDIWSVGFANLAPNPQQLLAEHWNGSSWSVVPTPNPAGAAGGSQFHGVAAAATNDVWAVGQTLTFDNTTGYTWHPLVEHWNGSAWSIVATPTLSTSAVLNAVTVISSTNVWAVGALGSGNSGNLIEHWDGTRWSVVAAPNNSTNGALLSVSGTSATDIWAVGRSQRHPNVEILHFNGQTWSNVAAPSPAFDSVLTGVTALAPNNVWAVGETNVGPIQTLIEHWDGMSWSVVPSPNPNGGSSNGNNVLSGIAAVAATDIWAAGYTTDPSTGLQQTLTEHWDGTSWSVIASPNAAPAGSSTLAGMTALGDGTVVAVGTISNNSNNNGLILQR